MSIDGEGDKVQGLRSREEDTEPDGMGKEHLPAERDQSGQRALRIGKTKGYLRVFQGSDKPGHYWKECVHSVCMYICVLVCVHSVCACVHIPVCVCARVCAILFIYTHFTFCRFCQFGNYMTFCLWENDFYIL